MAINTKKPTTFSQEEIADWESNDKHRRKIVECEFETEFNESGTARIWLTKPNRTNIEAAAGYGKDGKIKQANELLINACVIAGDIELLEQDDELFFAVLEEISTLTNVKKKL